MATPDEIKKGLEYLSITNVAEKVEKAKRGLPYAYTEEVATDALAYIQQLETKCHQLESTISQVSKALCGKENATAKEIIAVFDQVKRERDAAVADLKYANVRGDCWHCKHANNPERDADCYKADCDCETCQSPCPCATCVDGSNWQWRGVKED